MAGHIVWVMTQFAHPPHFCVVTARFPFIHFAKVPFWPRGRESNCDWAINAHFILDYFSSGLPRVSLSRRAIVPLCLTVVAQRNTKPSFFFWFLRGFLHGSLTEKEHFLFKVLQSCLHFYLSVKNLWCLKDGSSGRENEKSDKRCG